MTRGAPPFYPAELALAEGRVPTTLYTDRLKSNPVVSLPEEGYANNFSPEAIAAFERFADGFLRTFSADSRYPNARLSPAFMPSAGGRPGLTFMAAWGDKTEFPLPRREKIPEYFNPLVRATVSLRDTVASALDTKDQRKVLHRTTLDAHGFLGYFRKSTKGIEARIAYGAANVQTYQASVGQAALLAFEAYDAVAELPESALRFHAGILYVPGTQHIANEFAAGSQHDLVWQLVQT